MACKIHIFSKFDQIQSNPFNTKIVRFFKKCRFCFPQYLHYLGIPYNIVYCFCASLDWIVLSLVIRNICKNVRFQSNLRPVKLNGTSKYRDSLNSTNLNSTILDLVGFENGTKQCKFLDIVRFSLENRVNMSDLYTKIGKIVQIQIV